MRRCRAAAGPDKSPAHHPFPCLVCFRSWSLSLSALSAYICAICICPTQGLTNQISATPKESDRSPTTPCLSWRPYRGETLLRVLVRYGIDESPPSSDLAPFMGDYEIIKFEIVRHEDGTYARIDRP